MNMVPSISPPPSGAVPWCALLGATLLLPTFSASTGAQQVHGRLLDLGTARPIPAGVLALHAADSSIVATTVSDADGRWRFTAPRPGSYYVAARRLGYQPRASAAVTIATGAEVTTDLHLEPLPVLLDPVSANAAAIRRHLEFNGFFERQKGNFGHFLSPEAIERRQAARITDLLTAIPGVQRVVGSSGTAGPAQIGLRGSGIGDGALCRPRIFVDGLVYTRGDARPARVRASDALERETDLARRMDQALSLDDIGHPSTIAALEVYRSATQVPVQFGGTSVGTLCGVIVVWTRTGRMPARTP